MIFSLNILPTVETSSLITLLLQADIVVKIVMLLLLFSSLWSWAVIIDRLFVFKSLKYKMKKFEKLFWSGKEIEVLFKQVTDNKENHPLANVLVSAVKEWNLKQESGFKDKWLKERIYNAMQLSVSRGLEQLEINVASLATIGSIAPFVGLFGTVWGIMTSFQSIALSKNTSIAVVAPGIAEALLATAFGLVVAIPAVVFYNRFLIEINTISKSTEEFQIELSNIILREIEIKN